MGVLEGQGGYHRHPVYVFYVDSVICVEQGDKKNTISGLGVDSLPAFPVGHRKRALL